MLIFRDMLNNSSIYGLQRQQQLRKHGRFLNRLGQLIPPGAGMAHSLMCAEKRRRDTDVINKNPRSKTPG